MIYVVRDPLGFCAENGQWGQQQKLLDDATAELARNDGDLDKAAVGVIQDVFPMQIRQDQLRDWI